MIDKPPALIPEVNRQAYAELARSASNLNQIAHHLNIGKDVEMQAVRVALADFRTKLLAGN